MIDKLANNSEIKDLFEAILTLDTYEDCCKFFEDICTIKEMQSIAQRLAVAKMLKSGETYQAIVNATGASTATISRVNRCLNYGDGGYNIVLKRLEKNQ
ncbi:MAG: YerC/YecD family TrpR-related protein [Clostridia bacterium]|nr:YerC/YecD family TrpR-related protein [Clostridia bacterium]